MRHAARGLLEAANAGLTILTPTAELGAALNDAVERMHLAAGDEWWPTPRIRDYGGWLRERHALRQLEDASLPRLLSEVEERELWRAAVADSDAAVDFLEPGGAARSARRARRALFEYGIPEEALAGYGTDETTAFIEWNGRFRSRCRELDCIAADQLQFDDGGDLSGVCWIDSEIWHPTARRRLSRAGAPVHPPATASQASARRVSVATPAAELAAMAEWAREHLHTNADFRAWICIPDLATRRAQVLDAFDAAVAPRRFSVFAPADDAPYAVAGGTPLAGYAPVRLVLDALAAHSGLVSFEDFSALLRRPEWQAGDVAGGAAQLDMRLRARGPHEAPLRDWLTLASAQGMPPTGPVELMRTFSRSLEDVRGAHPLSRWAAVWCAAFDAGPWLHKSRWSSAEFQAAERLRELLAGLATSDAVFGAVTAAAAGRILARAASETSFQAQTGIPPVWVSARLMDPWLAYDGLWVATMSEDRWPPPTDPLPLLPVSLQRRYGVIPSGADDQLRLAEDLQRRWAMRADMNVFSCADSADGRASPMSKLLPAGEDERVLKPTHPHWWASRADAPPFDALMDEGAPVFDAPELTRGVATLRAQSLCPFRGFAETRLLTESLDKPQPGFNTRERGDMLHQALEFIWSELGSSARLAALDASARQALIEAGVTHAIRSQCARRDPGLNWQRRELPRQAALLDTWLDTELKREPFEVERLEQRGQVARHGGLEFNVRIDRMDRLADGGRVLIDYKTGVTSADWRGERPDNPQLPIYALLRRERLVAVAYGAINAVGCTFVSESERAGVFKPRARPSSMEGAADFAALVELWSRRIEVIAAEFAAGVAAVTPTAHACASCSLHALCRIPSALDEAEEP